MEMATGQTRLERRCAATATSAKDRLLRRPDPTRADRVDPSSSTTVSEPLRHARSLTANDSTSDHGSVHVLNVRRASSPTGETITARRTARTIRTNPTRNVIVRRSPTQIDRQPRSRCCSATCDTPRLSSLPASSPPRLPGPRTSNDRSTVTSPFTPRTFHGSGSGDNDATAHLTDRARPSAGECPRLTRSAGDWARLATVLARGSAGTALGRVDAQLQGRHPMSPVPLLELGPAPVVARDPAPAQRGLAATCHDEPLGAGVGAVVDRRLVARIKGPASRDLVRADMPQASDRSCG